MFLQKPVWLLNSPSFHPNCYSKAAHLITKSLLLTLSPCLLVASYHFSSGDHCPLRIFPPLQYNLYYILKERDHNPSGLPSASQTCLLSTLQLLGDGVRAPFAAPMARKCSTLQRSSSFLHRRLSHHPLLSLMTLERSLGGIYQRALLNIQQETAKLVFLIMFSSWPLTQRTSHAI